jgi:hypothetical protein
MQKNRNKIGLVTSYTSTRVCGNTRTRTTVSVRTGRIRTTMGAKPSRKKFF